MDREAWRAAIHGVTKSHTRLRDWTETDLSIYVSMLFCQFVPPSPSPSMSSLFLWFCLHCCSASRFIIAIFLDSMLLFSHPVMSDSLQPHGLQHSLSLSISQSLPKFMSIALMIPSSHLILWGPLLLLLLICPSIRDFYNESSICIRWPKYWSFNFSIRPSNEYSGLIFLKIDWLDILDVQGTVRSSLFQNSFRNSLTFWLLYSPPLRVILDHWEDHSLDYTDLCQWVMSLLFNTLSRFVIALLPRSNCLLISWLQLPSTVILETKKRKFVPYFHFSPSVCHEVMGTDAMILLFFIF